MTETPTKPQSFLFPSSAAFVGQMSVKYRHNFSFVRALDPFHASKPFTHMLSALKSIRFAESSTFELGVKEVELCSYTPCGIVGLRKSVFLRSCEISR